MTSKQVRAKGPKRKYKMTVAGQLFNHLGLQMYAGAVPAISEFISNSYDAMARNVWVTIPTGKPIQSTDQIIVEDDGHGMSYEECNSFYLHVGRDRRSSHSGWTKEYKGLSPRKVQGRKGIGKLAGFGIANIIDVHTIRKKEISHFRLDFEELTESSEFADAEGYEPEPLSDDGQKTNEPQGSRVTLSQLKISRKINEEQFKKSLARRLLILDDDFRVHVNGEIVTRQEIPFQFRFPKSSGKWETAEFSNGQQIEWWAGFCKDTIQNEEQRGFVVYVRGKLAQTPWFFDLSGGVWGQHGMQYLTGEVKADFLDENVDLISTDRGTIRWEDPIAVPLKEWGRKQVKKLLETWASERSKEKAKSPEVIQYLEKAKKLPDRERRAFEAAVSRICSIPQLDRDEEGKDITHELVKVMYNAMTNRTFFEAIKSLNEASAKDVAHFSEILSEWDIMEAISIAHVFKGRLEIIRTFKQMIEEKVREKPNMQDYLKDHPWLIDPSWTMLEHEKTLDKLIRENFAGKSSGRKEGKRRLDFFCLGDRNEIAYVVETKRPGLTVGREELSRLLEYVAFLRTELQDQSTNSRYRRTLVKGILIADRVRPEDKQYLKMATDSTALDTRTWRSLLTTAEVMYDKFLEVVEARAPSDDPRMKELSTDDSEVKPESGGELKPEKRQRKARRRK